MGFVFNMPEIVFNLHAFNECSSVSYYGKLEKKGHARGEKENRMGEKNKDIEKLWWQVKEALWSEFQTMTDESCTEENIHWMVILHMLELW